MYTGVLYSETLTEVLPRKKSTEFYPDPQIYVPEMSNILIEEQIITGCRNQERIAQKKLYEKYFGKMMAITRRYFKNHDDAIEVVNTGFLKIFTSFAKYKGTGSLEGWITRVIINTAIDQIRANKHYTDTIVLEEKFETKYNKQVENFDNENIDVEKLYRMIDKLPPMSKTVFNLYAIDGYSHKEISDKLNISVGTSKWHVSFARQHLREMLDSENIDYNSDDER